MKKLLLVMLASLLALGFISCGDDTTTGEESHYKIQGYWDVMAEPDGGGAAERLYSFVIGPDRITKYEKNGAVIQYKTIFKGKFNSTAADVTAANTDFGLSLSSGAQLFTIEILNFKTEDSIGTYSMAFDEGEDPELVVYNYKSTDSFIFENVAILVLNAGINESVVPGYSNFQYVRSGEDPITKIPPPEPIEIDLADGSVDADLDHDEDAETLTISGLAAGDYVIFKGTDYTKSLDDTDPADATFENGIKVITITAITDELVIDVSGEAADFDINIFYYFVVADTEAVPSDHDNDGSNAFLDISALTNTGEAIALEAGFGGANVTIIVLLDDDIDTGLTGTATPLTIGTSINVVTDATTDYEVDLTAGTASAAAVVDMIIFTELNAAAVIDIEVQ